MDITIRPPIAMTYTCSEDVFGSTSNHTHSPALSYQYIFATGALHGAGSEILLFFETPSFDPDGPTSAAPGIASSSPCVSALRFPRRFPLPFSFAALSLAARSARAFSRSSHFITLPSPFPSCRINERVVRRTSASLLMLYRRRLWSWRRLC